MQKPDKSLGQHWLKDPIILRRIAAEAELTATDTVLEIGPGLGTLTGVLCEEVGKVVAVEFDPVLASGLSRLVEDDRLTIIHGDILKFDLTSLPIGYKVVANVPYYITSKIIELLLTSTNPPVVTTLLVQKEVAQRIAAGPGSMSLLSLSAQLFAECKLGPVVSAEMFTPPPKVDSRVITLKRRPARLFPDVAERDFFRVARAGFSERRKKLRSSLSGGLQMDKDIVDEMLTRLGISPHARAQELTLDEWAELTREFNRRRPTPG